MAPLLAGLADIVPLADRATQLIRAPFTNEVIGTVPTCTADDVSWQPTRTASPGRLGRATLADRREIFLRYHDLVLDRQEQLLDLVQIEGGKARRNAIEEVYDVAINARYYAHHAASFLHPAAARPRCRS